MEKCMPLYKGLVGKLVKLENFQTAERFSFSPFLSQLVRRTKTWGQNAKFSFLFPLFHFLFPFQIIEQFQSPQLFIPLTFSSPKHIVYDQEVLGREL